MTRKVYEDGILSPTDMASLLMLSQTRLQQLVNDGIVKRHAIGQFKRDETVQGYIKFLRDDARRANRMNVDSRVREARAKDIEVQTAIRLSKLVTLTVYDQTIDSICGLVRAELAGFAAACTRDIPMRRIIERECDARLRRMADHARTLRIRHESSIAAADAVRANGASGVGGSEPDVSGNGSDTGS